MNSPSFDLSLDPVGEEGSERMSALHALVGFLHVLTNADVDGRIIVDAASGSLKFVLLNAAAHFTKVRELPNACS